MASRRLEVVIVGDTKGLEKAYHRAGKATESFGTKATKSLSGLAKGGIITAAVGGVALVTKSLFDSVGAARDAEAAQTRLRSALSSAGVSFDQHGAAIDRAIQKTSRLAALDDEDLSDAFAKLVRTTGDVTKATEGMNLAADIARARHISLEQATKTVERALLGNAGALKKVGVEVDKNTTSTEALERAQKQFSGSAAAYGASAAGAQDKLNVAFENLQETVGAKLLPVLQRLAIKLTELIAWSEKNWPAFKAAAEPVFRDVQTIISNMIDRIQGIVTVIQGVVKIIQGIRDGEWGTVWAGIKEVVTGAVAVIVATMVALPAKILGALSKAAFAGLSRIGEWIKEAVLSGLEGIGSGVVGMIQGAVNAAIDLLNEAIGAYNAIPVAPNIKKVGHIGASVSSAPSAVSNAGGSGRRAAGGPVQAGLSYLVGERGPEMFVPSKSGTIVPNGSASNSAPTIIQLVLDGRIVSEIVRNDLIQVGRRNGSALGGLA